MTGAWTNVKAHGAKGEGRTDDTADDGIDHIRRNYGQMLDENGGTFSECWATLEDEAACKSQVWGGALAATLIEEVVGMRPAAPGCGHLVWRPAVCRLAFADGRLDTPRGTVTVRWEAGGALYYDVPAGVRLEIRAGANALAVDGQSRVWPDAHCPG